MFNKHCLEHSRLFKEVHFLFKEECKFYFNLLDCNQHNKDPFTIVRRQTDNFRRKKKQFQEYSQTDNSKREFFLLIFD